MYVAFEGIDGAGKSTMVAWLKMKLEEAGREVVAVKWPGTTPLGLSIHKLLHSPESKQLDPVEEQLLVVAAAHNTQRLVVNAAREVDAVILSDRWDTLSRHAYSGARGMDTARRSTFDSIANLETPDLVILLDVENVAAAWERSKSVVDEAGGRAEADGSPFLRDVRDRYREAARRQLYAPTVVVDAELPLTEAQSNCFNIVTAALLRRAHAPSSELIHILEEGR